MSHRDIAYLLHLTDEAHLTNATPITVKWVASSKSAKDSLFDEVIHKEWDKEVIRGIVINRPSKEIQDRYGTRHTINLVISLSRLELERHGNRLLYLDPNEKAVVEHPELYGRTRINPTYVFENPDQYGKFVDYYVVNIIHDGEFIDTEGNTIPVSYSILLTDEKVPTNGINA